MARQRKHRKQTGSLERRGDSYRVRLCVNGKRHSFTVPTTDRAVARKAAEARYKELREAAARRMIGKPEAVTFSALLEQYEATELPRLAPGAQRSYRNSFPPFRLYFVETLCDPLVTSIRAGDVHGFLAWRRTHRLDGSTGTTSNHTVARDRRVLHRLFEFACELEHIDANPATRVAAPKGDPRTPQILSEEEFERLLDACAEGPPMLRLYVLLLGETGMRAYSEALRLRWEDVDLSEGFIHVVSGRGEHRTKTGRSRWVPMTARLRAAMAEHLDTYRMTTYGGKRSPWMFHHTGEGTRGRLGERVECFRKPFLRAVSVAGLPEGFRQHDLRHRRVTTWLAEGANPVHVKEAVGHSTLATTMLYTHLTREPLRALVTGATGPKPSVSL